MHGKDHLRDYNLSLLNLISMTSYFMNLILRQAIYVKENDDCHCHQGRQKIIQDFIQVPQIRLCTTATVCCCFISTRKFWYYCIWWWYLHLQSFYQEGSWIPILIIVRTYLAEILFMDLDLIQDKNWGLQSGENQSEWNWIFFRPKNWGFLLYCCTFDEINNSKLK